MVRMPVDRGKKVSKLSLVAPRRRTGQEFLGSVRLEFAFGGSASSGLSFPRHVHVLVTASATTQGKVGYSLQQ